MTLPRRVSWRNNNVIITSSVHGEISLSIAHGCECVSFFSYNVWFADRKISATRLNLPLKFSNSFKLIWNGSYTFYPCRCRYMQPGAHIWGNIIFHRSIRIGHGVLHLQRTHDVMVTSLLRQDDVATSFWRNNDVIIASCVRWIGQYKCHSTISIVHPHKHV